MRGVTPGTTFTRAIWGALGLLALVSLGAGDGPPTRPNPPGASAALPSALPADVRPPGAESIQAPSSGALAPPGLPLIPGQAIEPIDLAGVLRLAGARDLDIAIARQQVFQSIADLQRARALWLPSLFLGPTWYRLDGQVQAIDGRVMTVSRSSLSVNGLVASPNTYPSAPPGSGFAPISRVTSVLRFSDAIFEPKVASRVVAANQADVQTATNNALLAASEAYLDLLWPAGFSPSSASP